MSDIFISYSRKDIAFARLIQEALQKSQLDIWIDWERIPIGQKWWQEICQAIENANVFMFIISQNSIGSTVCKDEINEALKNNKRIIPIIVDNLKPEAVKEFVPELPQYNWVIFERDHIFQITENPLAHAEKPEDRQVALPKLPQFEEALAKLSQAIHTDWDWVKYHTQLQVDALRWQNNQQNPSYLIRGAALEDAERKLIQAGTKDPQPTPLQVNYVTSSRQEETHRQHEQLLLEQKSSKRQQFALWAVGIGLTVAVILAIIAWGQRNQYLSETHVRATAQADAVAEANSRATAESNAIAEANSRATAQADAVAQANGRATQEAIAITQRDEANRQARIAIAGKLDTETTMLLDKNIELALLLSLEAYRYSPSPQTSGAVLNGLAAGSRLVRTLHGAQSYTNTVAYSPDGKLLAADGCGLQNVDFTCDHSETDLWDAKTGQLLGKLIGDPQTSAAAAIAFSADSQQLYTVSQRGNVVIWDIKTLKPVDKIRWHERYVATAAFQPGGRLVALGECAETVTGGIDAQVSCTPGMIELWDTAARQPLKQPLTGIPGVVSALAFSPDGKYLAAGDYEHQLTLFDLQTGASRIIENLGPTHFVGELAFSPDSTVLAAGDSAYRISFFNAADGKPVRKAIQLQGLLTSLAISPDGKTLVSTSCANDPTCPIELNFWDAQTGNPLGKPLTGYSSYLASLVFSPDGGALAGAGRNSTLYIWDARNSQPLGTPLPLDFDYDAMTFSPDGSRLVTWGYLNPTLALWDFVQNELVKEIKHLPSNIKQAGYDPSNDTFLTFDATAGVVQWDAATGTSTAGYLSQYKDAMYHAVFSPDARFLATYQGMTVHLWDVSTGKLTASIDSGLASLAAISFSPDGKLLVVGGCGQESKTPEKTGNTPCLMGQANIYQVDSQALVTQLQTGQPGFILGAAFSNDNKLLAATTSDRLLQIWDFAAPAQPRVSVNMLDLAGKDIKYLSLSLAAFSPDDKYLAVGDEFQALVFLLDPTDGKMVAPPVKASYNLRSLQFTQDNTTLVAGSDSTYLITLANGALTAQPFDPSENPTSSMAKMVNRVALSADGRLLATGTDGAVITLWDMAGASPAKLFTLEGHADAIQSLVFSPDGAVLYSASRDMTLNRWDAATGQLIDQPMKGYAENSHALAAFSSDGLWAATSSCRIQAENLGCIQSELNLRSAQSGEIKQQIITPYPIFALVFSPDNHWLLDTSGKNTAKSSLEIHLWDLTATPPVSRMLVGGLDSPYGNTLTTLVFSPDGQILAFLKEAKLMLVQIQTGESLTLPTTVQQGSYSSIAFSPDSQLLALGDNSTLQLYDLTSQQVIGPQIQVPQTAKHSLAFSPDGKVLASGRPLTLWKIDPAAWVAQACQVANRNLTQEEWSTYLGDQPYHKTCPEVP